MRRSYKSEFLFGNDGLVALNLGADCCAEHEWGIKGIRRAFGITDDGYGVKRRMVRRAPPPSRAFGPQWGWLELPQHKAAGFCLTSYRLEPDMRLDSAHFTKEQTLWTGWSGETMGAFSTNEKEQKRLRELFDAIEHLDACIWRGGGGVFQNAGLVIGITSRIPHHHLKAWEQHDRDQARLTEDAKATGIEERLAKAGKRWFALSPDRKSDGSLCFWLNPCEQDRNNSGWFTVADLDDWIAGKGKIPKRRRP